MGATAIQAAMLGEPLQPSDCGGEPDDPGNSANGPHVSVPSPFISGKGEWLAQKSRRGGMAFIVPLIPVCSSNEFLQKSLAPEDLFSSPTADNLVLPALKKGDRDEAIVVRVFRNPG